MTDDIDKHEGAIDTSIPFSILIIIFLSSEMEKAKTDADKLTLLRRCLASYLVMNAGHFLYEGVKTLTDFILTEFTPFTEGGIPSTGNAPWLAEYPLTDGIFSQAHIVPDGHCDLFLSEEKDVYELVRQLTEQGLIESDEPEKEICNE